MILKVRAYKNVTTNSPQLFFSADWETRDVQIGFQTFVIGCQNTWKTENDVAMETAAAAAVTYGMPCR